MIITYHHMYQNLIYSYSQSAKQYLLILLKTEAFANTNVWAFPSFRGKKVLLSFCLEPYLTRNLIARQLKNNSLYIQILIYITDIVLSPALFKMARI